MSFSRLEICGKNYRNWLLVVWRMFVAKITASSFSWLEICGKNYCDWLQQICKRFVTKITTIGS